MSAVCSVWYYCPPPGCHLGMCVQKPMSQPGRVSHFQLFEVFFQPRCLWSWMRTCGVTTESCKFCDGFWQPGSQQGKSSHLKSISFFITQEKWKRNPLSNSNLVWKEILSAWAELLQTSLHDKHIHLENHLKDGALNKDILFTLNAPDKLF